MKPPSLTVGVEEEYQIINPETRELESYITQMLLEDHRVLTQIKPELHQSIVEVGTNVCQTPAEVRAELVELRRGVMELAGRRGFRIAAAGTHPFSHWSEQEITPLAHYVDVRENMQQLAEQLLIFGTHVHIGIEDREFLIDAANVARYVLTLVLTGSIPNGSKIWWDVRPHWKYPTLEFRICDVCTRVDEAVCIAAILQALIAKLWKMRRDNTTFRVYSSDLIDENKWRAVRYGLDGKLIDFGKQREFPARDLIRELIEWFIDDVVDELGSRKEIEYAFKILEEGSSADRQIAVYEKSGGGQQGVVDPLIPETFQGLLPA